MLTLTRTVYRFVRRDGTVVKEVAVEPGDFPEVRLTPTELGAYVAHLAARGDYGEIRRILRLPHYLSLVIPSPPQDEASREVWRLALVSEVGRALSPDYRKSMLIRYLESNRDRILQSAVERGVSRADAERYFRALLSEIRSATTLDEVVRYESLDPVRYIVSSASVHRVPS